MINLVTRSLLFCLTSLMLVGCDTLPPIQEQPDVTITDYSYTIAPGDRLDIFVWRNENISVSNIPVMPDGRISVPLVEEVMASGKTPIQLADDIEIALADLVTDPFVTVTVMDFEGSYSQQIRVVGEAVEPRAIPYRTNMSLLDVMIGVGGLTEFSAGNRATIVRSVNGDEVQFRVRLEDLIRRGDLTANIKVAPGDILIIPESLF